MNEFLESCPFCGENDIFAFTNHRGQFVGCNVCGIDVPFDVWQKRSTKTFYESLPQRNGRIEECTPNHWQVYCGECKLNFARPFATYQEASIWFTKHLEDGCKTKVALNK